MNLKFLPVGSVVLVEGVNKKRMIIGYLKSGYDYVAVEYPKGFETDNKLSYFNHEQIKELYSLGYKNEESRIYTGTLISSNMNKAVVDEETVEGELTPAPVIEEFRFDENGVVIEDSNSKLEEVQPLTSELKSDENGVVIEDGETSAEEKKEAPSKLKFDEHGVVIEDGETPVEEKKEAPSKLKFDENGVVIEDGETPVEEKKEAPSKLKFDENGIVIEDGETPVEADKDKKSTDKIVIDEAATIDVSDVVKQIEETVAESEKKEKKEETSKKEKRGLFHFGKK